MSPPSAFGWTESSLRRDTVRLCSVDLPERAKGAVKSNSGLASFAKVALATAAERVYRELGQGPKSARGILPSRSLFPQKTPNTGVFCYSSSNSGQSGANGTKLWPVGNRSPRGHTASESVAYDARLNSKTLL